MQSAAHIELRDAPTRLYVAALWLRGVFGWLHKKDGVNETIIG